jgi:hypothetical protein
MAEPVYKFEKEFLELLGFDINENYSLAIIAKKIIDNHVIRKIEFNNKIRYKFTDFVSTYLNISIYSKINENTLIKLIKNKIIYSNSNTFVDKYLVIGYEKPTKLNKLVVVIE